MQGLEITAGKMLSENRVLMWGREGGRLNFHLVNTSCSGPCMASCLFRSHFGRPCHDTWLRQEHLGLLSHLLGHVYPPARWGVDRREDCAEGCVSCTGVDAVNGGEDDCTEGCVSCTGIFFFFFFWSLEPPSYSVLEFSLRHSWFMFNKLSPYSNKNNPVRLPVRLSLPTTLSTTGNTSSFIYRWFVPQYYETHNAFSFLY